MAGLAARTVTVVAFTVACGDPPAPGSTAGNGPAAAKVVDASAPKTPASSPEPNPQAEGPAQTGTIQPAEAVIPTLRTGTPPERAAWSPTGWALSADGRQFAQGWSYPDGDDGRSGALDLWDVTTGERTATISGIPGGLCATDPGGRGCLQWRRDGMLGFVFQTHNVGLLDPKTRRFVAGTGDPRGADTRPSWAWFEDDTWLVGFSVDSGSSTPAMSVWRPTPGTLTPLTGAERGVGRATPLAEGALLGIRGDALMRLTPSGVDAVVDQVHRPAPRLPKGPAAFAQHVRPQASPDGTLVASDEADGIWLLDDKLQRIRRLWRAPADDWPTAFAWSADSGMLAVAVRDLNPAGPDRDRVLVADTRAAAIPHRLPGRAAAPLGTRFPAYHQPLAFTAAGLAILRGDTVEIVDWRTGERLKTLPAPEGTVWLGAGADGTLILAGAGVVAFSR